MFSFYSLSLALCLFVVVVAVGLLPRRLFSFSSRMEKPLSPRFIEFTFGGDTQPIRPAPFLRPRFHSCEYARQFVWLTLWPLLYSLCVSLSLSLMFTLAAPGALMESLCRNEIFVEHCERKGYHRIFVCINTFCKCKHDQYTTVRRALIPCAVIDGARFHPFTAQLPFDIEHISQDSLCFVLFGVFFFTFLFPNE